MPIFRYNDAVVASANIGSHVNRMTADEMTDRFLPVLNEMSVAAKPLLL